MPHHETTPAELEILSPTQQLRLAAWEDQQAEEEAKLIKLEALANLMDARFKLPIIPVPIGLDTIIGLIPGIGDTISLGVAGTIVTGTHRLGVSKHLLIAMGVNIFIDWLIGLIPIIGDLFDIGWQGSVKNVRLARAYLETHWEEGRRLALLD